MPAAPAETVGQSRDGDGAQPSSPLVVLGKPGFCFWWYELPHGGRGSQSGSGNPLGGIRHAAARLPIPPWCGPWRTEPAGLVLSLMVILGKSLVLPKIPPSAKLG